MYSTRRKIVWCVLSVLSRYNIFLRTSQLILKLSTVQIQQTNTQPYHHNDSVDKGDLHPQHGKH